MEFLNPTLISPTWSRLSFSHNFNEAPQGTKMWPISGYAFNAQHVRFLSVFLCACAAMSYFMQSLWYQNSEDKIFKGIQMSWQNKYPARCRSWWMFDDFCLTLLPGLENSRQHWGVWCDHSGSPAATTLAFLEPGKNSFNRTTLDTFHGYHLLSSSSSAHFFISTLNSMASHLPKSFWRASSALSTTTVCAIPGAWPFLTCKNDQRGVIFTHVCTFICDNLVSLWPNAASQTLRSQLSWG